MPKTKFEESEVVIKAIELALTTDIKTAAGELVKKRDLISSDPLTFKFDHEKSQYLVILRYGVIGLINWTKEFEEKAINLIQPYLNEPLLTRHSEDIKIIFDESSNQTILFDRVILPKFDEKSAIIIALLLAQSVGLDSYEEKADLYLDEFGHNMRKLEKLTPLLPAKELIKQVNKTLELQQDVISNLEVLDKPDISWESAELDKLYHTFSKSLELPERVKALSQKLELLKTNMTVAMDIANNKSLLLLEAIFILVVAFEVIFVLLEKLL